MVGSDPQGVEILAASGRYGPYLKRGSDTRSLEREEQLFTITVEEALALLAAPKTRGRRAPAPPLRELGADPLTGRPVVIKDGRFGPYLTDGESNASLRRGMTVEGMTLEQASQMLMEKRAAGPAPKKAAASKKAAAPRKAAAPKKAAAPRKAAAPKKAAARKDAAGKTAAARKAARGAAPDASES
jgi:DNA topoisomerase-1